MKMVKTLLWVPAFLLISGLWNSASANDHGGSSIKMMDNETVADSDTMKWERNRHTPWGMRIIVIDGDPSKEGPYTFRVKMPSGYKLPPHYHRDKRTVTVLKGTYWIGVGEVFDAKPMDMMEAGSFYTTEADVPHFAWARTEVILQESGYGPTDMRWVNPEDDPNY